MGLVIFITKTQRHVRLRSEQILTKLTTETWRAIHYLGLRKRTASEIDFEVVCPFHRGDVLLATQVANHLTNIGLSVRLHVAKPLVKWVMDFEPPFSVNPLSVDVPQPERVYSAVLRSVAQVLRLPDFSGNIIQWHPPTNLSTLRENLVERVLTQAGQKQASMQALKPVTTEEDRAKALRLFRAFDGPAILLHPIGGWSLKTIPPDIVKRIHTRVRQAGYRLIQVGGANDLRFDYVDGTICFDESPSLWRAIFEASNGIVGVDSWSSHFAAILDVSQVTLYGSTHPYHVNSKKFFQAHLSPSIIMGPSVTCSPCNSIKCLIDSNLRYCPGYVFDELLFDRFISSIQTTVRNTERPADMKLS